MRWHLESPGRHNYGDTMFDAITLRDGVPVAMQFMVSSNFDDCPCESHEYPKFIGDKVLATIAKVDTLEYLDLQHTSVSDAGIALLAEMPQLEFVNLSNTKVTGEGLRSLKRIRKLRKLKLTALASPLPGHRGPRRQGTEIFTALADCLNLRELQLNEVVLDDDAIHALLQLRQLEKLTIGGELNSNRDKVVFADQPNWRSVTFGFTGGFGDLEFREMPALRSLAVSTRTSRTHSPQIVDLFDNLPALESCSYSCLHNDRSDRAVPPSSRVRPRFQNVPKLKELHISGFQIELDIQEPLPKLETLTGYTNYEPDLQSMRRFILGSLRNLGYYDIAPIDFGHRWWVYFRNACRSLPCLVLPTLRDRRAAWQP